MHQVKCLCSRKFLTGFAQSHKIVSPIVPSSIAVFYRLPFALFSGKWNRHRQHKDVLYADHNLQRHQAIFAEHTSISSVARSYVAYLGPIPPVSSNANESVEYSYFNHCWNGVSGQNGIFTAHGFPFIDVQYQSWGHHSHPSSNSGHIDRTACASVAPATVRPTGVEYDDLTRFGSVVHPSFHGRGNSHSHERTSASHANGVHHQRQLSDPPGVPPPIIPLDNHLTANLASSVPQDQHGDHLAAASDPKRVI
ncbi:hypothetical protein RHGRI_025013 [Rhododendron griersonianum]|uniref:Uncharacterized protein n=1 Tax=Rhododendron griersonianum TaxID=479676 RepID=A0AAV6JCV9_9ERIC|nr:hypothetical protein RHGRI_025013 [Rhododendron griersonianum]